MKESSLSRAFNLTVGRIWLAAIILATVGHGLVRADGGDDGGRHRRPVYQRRASDWSNKHGRHRGNRFAHQWVPPQVNAGSFQRPYPYHLDYYKMRYGGSYAPYFGNLYGPPQVVTAPPYYGPYGGNFGYGEPNGYGQPGLYDGMPIEQQSAPTDSLPSP